MINLNKNIDNDINYLLGQIGHNIKINNILSSAIINNSDLERTFDDKRIISDSKIERGNYINYNDLNFIVLNELNDKRYKSYFKGIMRNCNYDIKLIIKDKLYLFHSVIEKEQSQLVADNNIISTPSDKIIVTLPDTKVTRKIVLNDYFISMGQKWKVEHTDRTRKGLIYLTCKFTAIDTNTDDIENEIAERYTDSKEDKLKGNIDPIYPFDTVIEEPTEPTEPEPTDPDPVDPPVEPEPEPELQNYIEFTGDTRINTLKDTTIKAVVYKDGKILGGRVSFTLSSNLAIIWSNTADTVLIKANQNWNFGEVTLTAISLEDTTIKAELIINVVSL